ncbi:MAG: hypothetical protein K2P88_03310 [Chitinophagaceae bacterium]|uniref:hypothetical protein n=1 Tax=unclassified Paraflavitalea TaxID=2798305 RepID=UPI003D3413F3|nr:hypothetical protein [Chitinophagaceae bacterium]
MSEFEPDVRNFLVSIAKIVSLTLMWLMLTLGLGLYNNWLIPKGELRWPNYVFYIIVIVTFVLLLRKLIEFWKQRYPHG